MMEAQANIMDFTDPKAKVCIELACKDCDRTATLNTTSTFEQLTPGMALMFLISLPKCECGGRMIVTKYREVTE